MHRERQRVREREGGLAQAWAMPTSACAHSSVLVSKAATHGSKRRNTHEDLVGDLEDALDLLDSQVAVLGVDRVLVDRDSFVLHRVDEQLDEDRARLCRAVDVPHEALEVLRGEGLLGRRALGFERVDRALPRDGGRTRVALKIGGRARRDQGISPERDVFLTLALGLERRSDARRRRGGDRLS